MDSFLPALRAAGTMTLELGCGPGEDAAALAVHGFRVVGFDLVPKAVRRAVVNAPDAHLSRCGPPVAAADPQRGG